MNDAGPRDDPTLMALTASGDRRAFHELVHRHRDAVFRWARSLSPSDDVAEDVLQETFLAAFRNAASFEGRSSVKTWLMTIARNQAHRRRRKPELALESEPSLERLGLAAGWGAAPGSDPERAASATELRAALMRLSEDDRQVLVARDLEGLTGPETAALVGISLAAMKARLHRARLRLVAELRTGDTPDGS